MSQKLRIKNSVFQLAGIFCCRIMNNKLFYEKMSVLDFFSSVGRWFRIGYMLKTSRYPPKTISGGAWVQGPGGRRGLKVCRHPAPTHACLKLIQRAWRSWCTLETSRDPPTGFSFQRMQGYGPGGGSSVQVWQIHGACVRGMPGTYSAQNFRVRWGTKVPLFYFHQRVSGGKLAPALASVFWY